MLYFIYSKTDEDTVAPTTKALAFKEKGNDAFKRKEYEVAEKLYRRGLSLIIRSSESRPFWTNLAICGNILKKYEDALDYCHMALNIDPKCTKAGFQSE